MKKKLSIGALNTAGPSFSQSCGYDGIVSATPPHLRVISSSSQLGHCFLSQFSTAASSSGAALLSVRLVKFCPMLYNSNADESITNPVAVTFCNWIHSSVPSLIWMSWNALLLILNYRCFFLALDLRSSLQKIGGSVSILKDNFSVIAVIFFFGNEVIFCTMID